MADGTIDSLNIQISSDANRAVQAIDSLQKKLGGLNTALNGLNVGGLSQISTALDQINTENIQAASSVIGGLADKLSTLGSVDFAGNSFSRLINSLGKLGDIDTSKVDNNIVPLMDSLKKTVDGLNDAGQLTFNTDSFSKMANSLSRLGGNTAIEFTNRVDLIVNSIKTLVKGINEVETINFDVTGLANLTQSITRLGGKAAGNAVPNIQALGTALKQLMATLSTAPKVSQNLIDMTNALGNLAKNGSRVSTASRAMQNGLNGFSMSARTATKHTRGLVSQIGLFYAKFFLLIRSTKGLGKAAKSAMDYVETLNYFNSAFRQVAQNADVSDWQRYGYKSADAYADSFEARSKQLTQKLTGFNVDESGELTRTGMPSLGLDPNKVLQYQATFAQMASSMGVASEQSLKLSNALTMIGADLASVRNMEFEDVWNDMASGMVGMSRTLDKYGVNIRNVNLQQELYNLGIDRSIAKLNQQDKAVLRTIVLLNSTQYAYGDLSRTINAPANQLRVLQSNFASLARTLGSLFIPIISKVLPYINALVIALQRLFAWIGGLLGVKLSGFTSSVGGAAVEMGDFADSADGAAGSLGDANKEAKKLKGNLQSFDELNTISINDDASGGGGGAGGGGGGIPELDAALDAALAAYQKAWDEAFANMENRANELADKVVEAFKRIWDTAEPTREALKRLWNEGLAQLGNFTWTALQDFWNEFLVPLGNWSLGTGFPMLIDAVNNFLTAINWTAINDALRNFWQALEPFAEKVGEGLIQFFDDLLQVGAKFINFTVPDGLNSIAGALKNIDPKTAENIGYGLGILAGGILAFKTLAPAVKVLSDIQKSMKNWNELKTTFKWLGGVKYLAIAAGIGGVILALDEFGYIKVNWKTLSSAFGKLATALGKFAVGIGKGLISFVDGLLDVLSPVLEGLINGLAWALDGLGSILKAIPEGGIAGVTDILLTFFAAFKTYEVVIKVGGLISTLVSNLKLLAGVLPGIVNSGPILKNLAAALGPSALGGIKFTLIAGGLITLAGAFKKFYDDATDNPELEAWADEFNESLDKINDKSEEISDNLDQLKKDYSESGEAQSKVAEDLAKKYITLHEKTNPTAADIALMKQYSKDLVDYYPELEQYFNDESGLLEINREDIQKVIDKQKEMVKAKASLSGLEEAYKQQAEAQLNLAEAHKKEQEALAALQKQREEKKKYLEEHPTYAATGNQGLFEGDLLGHEIDRINNALLLSTEEYSEQAIALENAQSTLDKAGETINYFAEEYDKAAQQVYDTTPDIISSFNEVGASVSENLARKLSDAGTEALEAVHTMFSQLQAGTLQSGEQLKAVFDGLGIEMPNAFMEALASQTDATTQSQMAQMFLNLGAGAKQSSESLKTIFYSVGLELPDSIISGLAEKEGPIQQSTVTLLGNIESGEALTEKELFDVFSGLGLDLSDELATALANGGSGVQEDTIELLSSIEAGEKIKEQDLIDLFSKLGVDLPEEFHKSISSQNAETQKKVIELLDRVFTGERLRAPELTKLFSGLGLEIPNELIKSLESKNGDTQQQAIELIGQIFTATDEEREPLIEKLNDLGVDGAESLNSGLGSMTTEIGTTSEENVKAIKEPVEKEFNSTTSGSMYDYGSNASKGFWQGVKDWWDDSWLGRKINEFKETVSGKEGLDEHSPSKIMRQFGAFAIEGFNIGLSDEMYNTFSALREWTGNIRSFDIPSFSTGYEINRNLLDTVDVRYRTPDYSAQKINAQLDLSLAGDINELIAETRRQNELLEVIANKPVIDKNDIGGAYISYAKDYRKQTGKQLGTSY